MKTVCVRDDAFESPGKGLRRVFKQDPCAPGAGLQDLLEDDHGNQGDDDGANEVEDKPRPHHVADGHFPTSVHDGVGRGRDRQHKGTTRTHGRWYHQQHRVDVTGHGGGGEQWQQQT